MGKKCWRKLPATLRDRPWLLAAMVMMLGLLVWFVGPMVLPGRDATWERIQETGVWRVGMDPSFPPFEHLDEATGAVEGFDVDLVNAMAAEWDVRAEFVGVGFDQLVDAVAAHRVDSAVSALPIFEWRAKEVAFSVPYVEAGVVLAVPSDSPITLPEELAGRRVAAEWGSSGDAQARALQQKLDGNISLVLRESPDSAMASVEAGEADAVIVDAVSLALFDRAGGDLRAVGEPLQPDPYVVIVPVDAPELLDAVNRALMTLEAEGVLADLKARWLSPHMP